MMSEDHAISVAGVRLALGSLPLPTALDPWRVKPRARDLRIHVRHGQPLAAPGVPSTVLETGTSPRLEVSIWRERFHLTSRDATGQIERSAVFDPRGPTGEIILSPHVDPRAADGRVLEWLVLVQLAAAGGFVLDACAGVKEGRALLFAANPDSNALPVAADLLRWHPDARLVGERRVAVHATRGLGWIATRWPWPLTSKHAVRGSGAIQAIHRIHRAAQIVAEPLAGNRAIDALGEVCVRPTGHALADEQIDASVARCVEAVPTIELGFPADARFPRYAFGRMPAEAAPRPVAAAHR